MILIDDYYPGGLTFNSYKREFSKKNKMNTFQDQEYDEETGWVQFKWRNHMPELGRFFNVDPLAEDYYYNSPYAFSENKVTAHIELEGLEALSIKSKNGNQTNYTYNKDGTITASTSSVKTQQNLKFTGALTNGTVGGSAKVGNTNVGGAIKDQSIDLIGVRDNNFMFGGKNKSGDFIEKTGVSGFFGVGAGFEGTAINGERTTEESFISVPFLTNSIVTGKDGSKSFEQSSDLLGVEFGIGIIGIELGVTFQVDQSIQETSTTYSGELINSNNNSQSNSSSNTNQEISNQEIDQIKEFINSLQ